MPAIKGRKFRRQEMKRSKRTFGEELQQAIRKQYVDQLHDYGVYFIKGEPLDKCDDATLRQRLAVLEVRNDRMQGGA